MLVIEGNSVYEIDEECVKKRGVSGKCGIDDKLAGKLPHRQTEAGLDFPDRKRQNENA